MYTLKRIKWCFFLLLARLPMPSRKVRPWFVKMGGVDLSDYKSVFIGSNVIFDTLRPDLIHIAGNTIITTGTVILSHFYNTSTKKFEFGDVFIGRNVFIGCNSIVCKPIEIGDCSIIGAGSILTKNIPAHQLWCGNPAIFIKLLYND